MRKLFVSILLIVLSATSWAAKDYVPQSYTWTSQSKNSSESMPCGGHDIGMNIWVENGDILVYLSRSNFFDENNTLLKAGRLRLHLTQANGTPVFGQANAQGNTFNQTLNLDEGCVLVKSNGVMVRLWADVKEPVVFVTIGSKSNVKAVLSYESWRYKDRPITKEACQQSSWKWLITDDVLTYADSICPSSHELTFEHHNRKQTVFDYTVHTEALDAVKDQIIDPIGDLSFGGRLSAPAFTYIGKTDGKYTNTDFRAWNYEAKNIKSATISVELLCKKGGLDFNNPSTNNLKPHASLIRSAQWWHKYWQRSYIKPLPATSNDSASIKGAKEIEKIARNYELFRYMLGCNAYGEYPTKFNGGLFTFDPIYVHPQNPFTPDFRCWGGGTMTAQNQRLIYWPMLKSGDTDMMVSQFDTYMRMLPGAVARCKHYWGHPGAAFEEQIESFGLPNPAEYGDHSNGEDPSWMNNLWLEYQWDTALEFVQMILEANEYAGMNIDKYRDFIRETVCFYDEHYRYLARKRGAADLTENGKLILYPSAGCETYKMAYNASSVIAALKYVTQTINNRHGGLAAWGLDSTMVNRIPDIPLRQINGETCIAPAEVWQRIQNEESTQLYPVFPWRIYGLGRPDIDIARNTYFDDDWVQKMRKAKGWKQDNIWAADLGILHDAVRLCKEKFADGPHRFPTFWERGFDWTPDHNRGGSAMIGLQEMLLQEKPDGELMIFPCWPKEWNCEYRLCATGNRVVDAKIVDGNISGDVSKPEGKKIISTPIARQQKITIFGDSYSTFESYITPDTNEPWYYWPTSKGKAVGNDVSHPDQTWWWQVLERLGARLETNNAYSGSTVGYTGYIEHEGEGHANYKPRSFITRANNLGDPDLILVCAGTNDSWDGEELGEYKFSDWTEQDLFTFRPAMAKWCSLMKELYPQKRIVYIINSELKPDFVESMHTILTKYGIEYLDLHDIDKQWGHPSVKGMKSFADQVVDYLTKK